LLSKKPWALGQASQGSQGSRWLRPYSIIEEYCEVVVPYFYLFLVRIELNSLLMVMFLPMSFVSMI
jgi:hypothetical protein